MSYPGTDDLEIVGVMRSCVNSAKKQVASQFDKRSRSQNRASAQSGALSGKQNCVNQVLDNWASEIPRPTR